MQTEEASKALLDIRQRRSRVEAKIIAAETVVDTKMAALREVYGSRIPSKPTEVPFQELSDEVEAEYEGIEEKITELTLSADSLMTTLEKMYDEVNGSQVGNG